MLWRDRAVSCPGEDYVGTLLTQHQGGPAGDAGLQALVEDLMQEHDGLTERKSAGELLPGLPTSLGRTLLDTLVPY